MKELKRFAALALCGGLLMSSLAGCGNDAGTSGSDSVSEESSAAGSSAEESAGEESGEESGGEGQEGAGGAKTYDENISFTMTSFNMLPTAEYTNDAFYDYLADKFNIDVEIWSCEADGADEKQRLWINGGTMPNVMMWDEAVDFAEYYEYIRQDLLQPLPDGWRDKWPNLAKMVDLSGYAEYLEVDGKTYTIPHAVFGNYLDMEAPIPSHISLYFRKDWAKQVGMENMGDGHKVTLSELKEYLEKVGEEGLATMPCLGASSGGVNTLFVSAFGLTNASRGFVETSNGFEWIPNMGSGYTDMIANMREWYQAGLIDPDYHTKSAYDYRSALVTGQLAATYDSGDATNMSTLRSQYQEEFPDRDPYEDIAVAHILNDDGSATTYEVGNFWTAHLFSPETDEKTLERILDVMDWFAGKEGQTASQIGIPGVDWEYAEDGSISVINSGAKYPSQEAFYLLGFCADDFVYSRLKDGVDPRNVDDTEAVFAVKKAGTITPVNVKYEVYDSEVKSQYSVPTTAKVNELVCGNEDIEAAWAAFIEEYRNLWEPLQEELNSAYGY